MWTNQVFSKRLHNMGSIIFNNLNSVEIHLSEYWFSRDSIFVNVSVSSKWSENLSPWCFPFFPFRENNSWKSFEVSLKLLIDILSFGQFWHALSGETLSGRTFRHVKMRIFHKKCYHFSPTVFFPINILLFCHFQLRLKPIRWNSN